MGAVATGRQDITNTGSVCDGPRTILRHSSIKGRMNADANADASHSLGACLNPQKVMQFGSKSFRDTTKRSK